MPTGNGLHSMWRLMRPEFRRSAPDLERHDTTTSSDQPATN
jgi:hypothetical protein